MRDRWICIESDFSLFTTSKLEKPSHKKLGNVAKQVRESIKDTCSNVMVEKVSAVELRQRVVALCI